MKNVNIERESDGASTKYPLAWGVLLFGRAFILSSSGFPVGKGQHPANIVYQKSMAADNGLRSKYLRSKAPTGRP